MKEGLQSGLLPAKSKNDNVVLEKDDYSLGNQEKGFESNDAKMEVLISSDLNVDEASSVASPRKSMEIEGKMTGLENVGCDENGDTSRRACKRGRGNGNEYDGGDDVDMKKLKEEPVDGSNSDVKIMKVKEEVVDGVRRKKLKDAVVNGNIVMSRRVLRSRTMAMRVGETEKTVSEVKVDMGGWSGSVKEETDSEVKVDMRWSGIVGEVTGSDIEVYQEQSNSVMDKIRHGGNKPSVEKIVQMEKVESNSSVGGIKNKLKRKRGRPPKIQRGNSALKEDKKRKILGFTKRKKDSKLVVRVKRESLDDSCSGKKLSGKDLNSKGVASTGKGKSDDSETEDKEISSRIRSENVGAPDDEKKRRNKGKKEKNGTGKLAEKQLLRQRIIDMLFEFGWKIEYRPRRGKEYNDAIYVSPEGRGYWSVTLAYNVLKKKFEDGDGDNKHSTSTSTSPVFTAIPEEVINKLSRITKQRKERERKKKKGVSNPDEVVIDKKPATKKRDTENTRSLSHTAKKNYVIKLGRKLSKGRLKRKKLHNEKHTSTGTSKLGMPISVRNHNSQGTQSRKRCALLVRGSKNGDNLEGYGYAPYPWKRTVLTWMIDMKILPLDGKVQYLNQRKTQVVLEGKITRDGIQCGCCDEIVSIAKFETHSGSKLSQPLQNIFLESGTSLLQCQLDSWNKQEESERKGFHYIGIDGDDPNDDTCGICGDGGDLICCDSCPSTFHQSCLDLQKFPAGDWHCVYCLCKFCDMVGGDNHDITSSMLSTCHLCEEKYHKSCIQAEDSGIDDPGDSSFCGKNCLVLFEKLQMLLGVEHELEDGFSWSLIKRYDVDSDLSVSLMPQKVKANSQLAVALSIMDECFLPFADHRTGINLIRNILYNFGSNFNRLNYSGFYTAILERGDEIISAASIRIHGCRLAEMPFIATRHMYRRQGMCSRLLSAIERALRSLNVEKLVIPAISELMQTWTSVFGFKPLEISKRQEMKNMNMLVFPGTDMLQKPLLEHQFSEDIKPTADLKSDELREVHETPHDTNTGGENVTSHTDEISCETIARTGSQLPDGSLNDASDLTNNAINFLESAADLKHLVQLDTTSHTLDWAKETLVNSDISACDAHERNEQHTAREISKDHNVDPSCIFPAPDERTAEQHFESNEGGNCVESELLIASHHASMVDTETVSSEVGRIVGNATNDSFSPDAMSVCSTEFGVTQVRNVAKNGLQASCQKIVCHESETTNYIPHDSQQSQVSGCFDKEIDSQIQTCKSFDVAINSTSSGDVRAGQDVANGCASLADDCNLNSSILCPATTNCHLMSLASEVIVEPDIQSSCILSAPDVVNHCGAPEHTRENLNGPKVAPAESQIVSSSFDCDILPDIPQKTTLSLKPDSESQADHTGVAVCDSESLCNPSSASGVALLRAPSGCNARGTPEVVVVSNQAG